MESRIIDVYKDGDKFVVIKEEIYEGTEAELIMRTFVRFQEIAETVSSVMNNAAQAMAQVAKKLKEMDDGSNLD